METAGKLPDVMLRSPALLPSSKEDLSDELLGQKMQMRIAIWLSQLWCLASQSEEDFAHSLAKAKCKKHSGEQGQTVMTEHLDARSNTGSAALPPSLCFTGSPCQGHFLPIHDLLCLKFVASKEGQLSQSSIMSIALLCTSTFTNSRLWLGLQQAKGPVSSLPRQFRCRGFHHTCLKHWERTWEWSKVMKDEVSVGSAVKSWMEELWVWIGIHVGKSFPEECEDRSGKQTDGHIAHAQNRIWSRHCSGALHHKTQSIMYHLHLWSDRSDRFWQSCLERKCEPGQQARQSLARQEALLFLCGTLGPSRAVTCGLMTTAT